MQLNDFKFSEGFEAALFASAEEVLAKRRNVLQVPRRAVVQPQLILRHPLFEFAAIAALLVVCFYLFQNHGRSWNENPVALIETLPDFPKTNDVPARYDAQWSAQQIAYEKEVENAHERTRGDQ